MRFDTDRASDPGGARTDALSGRTGPGGGSLRVWPGPDPWEVVGARCATWAAVPGRPRPAASRRPAPAASRRPAPPGGRHALGEGQGSRPKDASSLRGPVARRPPHPHRDVAVRAFGPGTIRGHAVGAPWRRCVAPWCIG